MFRIEKESEGEGEREEERKRAREGGGREEGIEGGMDGCMEGGRGALVVVGVLELLNMAYILWLLTIRVSASK